MLLGKGNSKFTLTDFGKDLDLFGKNRDVCNKGEGLPCAHWNRLSIGVSDGDTCLFSEESTRYTEWIVGIRLKSMENTATPHHDIPT